MGEEKQQLHVMMFPWLAYGHIGPFLELAKNLGANGLKISILSSPLNIRWIRQQIPQLNPIPVIDLLELPLPSVDGLPEGVESAADLKQGDSFHLLVKAMDEWKKPFEDLLGTVSPDFVIHDMTQYWASESAAKLGIPTIFFVTTSLASTGFRLGHIAAMTEKGITVPDLTVPPPGFPSSHIRRAASEAHKFIDFFQEKEGDINPGERWSVSLKGSWVVLFNTCVELEGEYMDYLQTIIGRPVLPVGVLMPDLPPPLAADSCLAWLDLQQPCSVVVVSFGSQCILNTQELGALAAGLEESGFPFLFVLLRQMAAELPQGFVERTQGRGLLVTEWAPQLHILSHTSVGAFLTHCGWNSVTEGLRFGVPFVTLPLLYDQGLIAKLIAQEVKVGVEIRRSEEDDSFSKEDVSKAIRRLMEAEEGRLIRSNVQEIGRVLNSNDCQIYRSNIHNLGSLLKEKASCKKAI